MTKTIRITMLALVAGLMITPTVMADQHKKTSDEGSEVKAGKDACPMRQADDGMSKKHAEMAAKEQKDKLDFTLTNHKGKEISLSDYDDRIVVLEWINPECPFVKRHYKAGTMQKLEDKYDDKGVVWLAINSTHWWNQKKNAEFAEKHDLDYMILDDSSGKVGRQYGAKTTPHMVIIHDGEIVYNGAIDNDPRGKKKSPKNHVDNVLAALTSGEEVSKKTTKPYGCSVKYAPQKGIDKKHDFTLADHKGKEVTLSDHSGKIIVLEWINPDCPFVKRHYKEGTMARLEDKYDDKGVVWLAVNSTNYFNEKKNREFAKKHDLDYPVLNDRSGKVGRQYGAKTTPHMFIFNKDGKLVYSGAIDDDPRGNKDKPVNYVDETLKKLTEDKEVARNESKPYGCSVKYAKPEQEEAIGE